MLILLYSAFAALCGVVEAVLYSRRGAEAFTRNEHIDMTLQRAVVLLLVPASILVFHWTGSWWYVGAECAGAVLVFPMVHDEVYNFVRLWIREREALAQAHYVVRGLVRRWFGSEDGYALGKAWEQYRYGYQSPSTTARNDFNGTQRTWLALTGLVVWLMGGILAIYGS